MRPVISPFTNKSRIAVSTGKGRLGCCCVPQPFCPFSECDLANVTVTVTSPISPCPPKGLCTIDCSIWEPDSIPSGSFVVPFNDVATSDVRFCKYSTYWGPPCACTFVVGGCCAAFPFNCREVCPPVNRLHECGVFGTGVFGVEVRYDTSGISFPAISVVVLIYGSSKRTFSSDNLCFDGEDLVNCTCDRELFCSKPAFSSRRSGLTFDQICNDTLAFSNGISSCGLWSGCDWIALAMGTGGSVTLTPGP